MGIYIMLSFLIGIVVGCSAVWIWNRARKPIVSAPEPEPERKWIGNIYACFTVPPSSDKYKFWFQLYEDSKGKRSYEITGHVPSYLDPESHIRYSSAVYPWLNGGSRCFVWDLINDFDYSYWVDAGFDVTTRVHQVSEEPPKPELKKDKPEFKLLKFPGPNEKEKSAADDI